MLLGEISACIDALNRSIQTEDCNLWWLRAGISQRLNNHLTGSSAEPRWPLLQTHPRTGADDVLLHLHMLPVLRWMGMLIWVGGTDGIIIDPLVSCWLAAAATADGGSSLHSPSWEVSLYLCSWTSHLSWTVLLVLNAQSKHLHHANSVSHFTFSSSYFILFEWICGLLDLCYKLTFISLQKWVHKKL